MKTISKNQPERHIKSDNLFPVVGIGASAGGLDALKILLKAIPEDSGMAFVIVQHSDPTRESQLPKILQKYTKIPVSVITDEVKIEPNHIYVKPSNKVMEATDGVLLLFPRPENNTSLYLPIDQFFNSLAENYQEHAIGVVLSGTATDGTLGLKAIKDNGGITIAQDKETAEYPGMPENAVKAGVVDFVLSPDYIPKKLREVTKIIKSPAALDQPVHANEKDIFRQIISLIRVRKGSDFTYYKQSTIRRRILRRMAITKKRSPAEYLNFLRDNKQEQDILYQDFLIPVTSFFRDPEIFDYLCESILPFIKQNKPDGDTIRVWVAGCSSGEEAYSVAICLMEILGYASSVNMKKRVQIFASDIREAAIVKARSGSYTEMEVAGVSEERLKKFFTKTHDGYEVKSEIRDMCVFARHNFLEDPPFSKMDLISCRNVMIYLEPTLQKQALTTFHYALNPNGYLLLGKMESISVVPSLFASADKKMAAFTRKPKQSSFTHVDSQRFKINLDRIEQKTHSRKKHSDYQKTANEILLNKYTPPGVIVNEGLDIVHFIGNTGNYLEQQSGKPSHHLLTLAKQGLAFELRNIIHKTKKTKDNIKKEDVPVKINGNLHNISIEAIPLFDTREPYYLILFHDHHETGDGKISDDELAAKKAFTDKKKDARIKQLEQELVQAREDMLSITEDQELKNEELQSGNEELLSSSVELQSLNEQLESSKEELQSTNEELIIVNQEMVNLNEQIVAERNFSEAIVANIREPLLVLDNNLRIKTANNAFYNLFKGTEGDTEGALIYELDHSQWNISELRTLLENIVPDKSVINDFEVVHTFDDIGELHLLLNAREVITDNQSDKLILLSIEDITEQVKERAKRLEIQERHTKELEEKIQERTIELQNANEELLQKNEELLKMNKELEAFNYVSSHDLQEPLRKIQTFAGRILEKENQNLSDKGKTYFALMQDSAHRMQGLIEDLLEFSRLSTSERKYKTTNLEAVIEEVKDNLKETIKEKNAKIEIKEVCDADVVEFQFRQLMQNLISNALKFSKPDTQPHIVIKCRIKDGKDLSFDGLSKLKKYCHISVTDNGIGFEKKFSDKIFEVFQKLHGKDEYPGTGIGLATVKKIVDNHNGKITAKSELNKGTTFDIYIPAHNI